MEERNMAGWGLSESLRVRCAVRVAELRTGKGDCMADRLVIVAAVGADRQARHAHAFGMAVAKSGGILLTRGGDHDDEQEMDG
jgi:hypothetical protein